MSSAQNDSAEPQPIDPRTLLGINSFGQPIWRAVVQAGLFFTVAGLGVSMALGQPPKPELGWSIALLGAVAGVVVIAFAGALHLTRDNLFLLLLFNLLQMGRPASRARRPTPPAQLLHTRHRVTALPRRTAVNRGATSRRVRPSQPSGRSPAHP